jgi:AcrR family transcriptional regulator
MVQRSVNVKPKRSYDARRRQEQARRNRAKILDCGERLFLRDGYGATTIASIAHAADVSPDTIYKVFGGKPGLVRALRDRALQGDGPVPAERRSDQVQARESDPREIIRAWGQFTAEVAPRVAPILLLVRDAASTDMQARALRDEVDKARLRRMTQNARRLQRAGYLRPGITLARASDVLWTYSSPELYELLVLNRGWSAKRFGRFVADAMADALL